MLSINDGIYEAARVFKMPRLDYRQKSLCTGRSWVDDVGTCTKLTQQIPVRLRKYIRHRMQMSKENSTSCIEMSLLGSRAGTQCPSITYGLI